MRDPRLKADHKGADAFSNDDEKRSQELRSFVFDTCKAQANWNMENFIKDQVRLLRKQVGDKKGAFSPFRRCGLLRRRRAAH